MGMKGKRKSSRYIRNTRVTLIVKGLKTEGTKSWLNAVNIHYQTTSSKFLKMLICNAAVMKVSMRPT